MELRTVPYDLIEKIIFSNAEKSQRLHRIGRNEIILRNLAIRVAMYQRDNFTSARWCSSVASGILDPSINTKR